MSYQLFLVAREHVDDWNLNHGVATRLLVHCGTCSVDEHLCCEGRVVDAHVELEVLVVSLAADTLAYEVHAVTYSLRSSTLSTC